MILLNKRLYLTYVRAMHKIIVIQKCLTSRDIAGRFVYGHISMVREGDPFSLKDCMKVVAINLLALKISESIVLKIPVFIDCNAKFIKKKGF